MTQKRNPTLIQCCGKASCINFVTRNKTKIKNLTPPEYQFKKISKSTTVVKTMPPATFTKQIGEIQQIDSQNQDISENDKQINAVSSESSNSLSTEISDANSDGEMLTMTKTEQILLVSGNDASSTASNTAPSWYFTTHDAVTNQPSSKLITDCEEAHIRTTFSLKHEKSLI